MQNSHFFYFITFIDQGLLTLKKLLKEKRGLGDCPQDFDFGVDFVFYAPHYPKRSSRVVFAGRSRRREPWVTFLRGFCEER